MTPYDACTSGISQILTVASLQRLKMEALNLAPSNCEVRSAIIFNAQIIAPKFISCASSQFPMILRSLIHKIVTEYLLFGKLCTRWVPKQLTAENKAKRLESALTIIVVHLFLRLKKFLSGQRFQNYRDAEMGITQGSNPRRLTSMKQGYKS